MGGSVGVWSGDGNTVRMERAGGVESAQKVLTGNRSRANQYSERKSPAAEQNRFLELTWQGKLLCGALGLIELIFIFLVFGIRFFTAPAAATCFLWFLLAMVTGGVLIAAEEFREWLECGMALK